MSELLVLRHPDAPNYPTTWSLFIRSPNKDVGCKFKVVLNPSMTCDTFRPALNVSKNCQLLPKRDDDEWLCKEEWCGDVIEDWHCVGINADEDVLTTMIKDTLLPALNETTLHWVWKVINNAVEQKFMDKGPAMESLPCPV
jgi:hypothetical protein